MLSYHNAEQVQLASRWNFCFFTSGGGNKDSELGSVRAVQMEFETTVGYNFVSLASRPGEPASSLESYTETRSLWLLVKRILKPP